MDISANGIMAAATVLGLVQVGAGAFIKSAFQARDSKINSCEKSVNILFAKYDTDSKELQTYKLHVAETYVNLAALQKMFDPIDRRLADIEKDLRNRRAD